jgi:hypothetical protein
VFIKNIPDMQNQTMEVLKSTWRLFYWLAAPASVLWAVGTGFLAFLKFAIRKSIDFAIEKGKLAPEIGASAIGACHQCHQLLGFNSLLGNYPVTHVQQLKNRSAVSA